ncbi:MAG: VanZ family protein [Bacteroidales bacterium]|nr:VanZ family protein [Bacteroidales bacterium]
MGKLINKFRPYARILLAFWIILVIVLAILPDLPVPMIGGRPIPIRLDYPVHFLEHMLLAFLAIISFVTNLSEIQSFRVTLLFLILFAVLMEMLHIVIPCRSFEYKDLALNIAGVFIGTLIAILSLREKQH